MSAPRPKSKPACQTKRRLKTASFLSLLFVFSGLAAAQPGQQFLIVSDIHFNPLANPALAGQLMAAEPSQWESIFAADAHSPAQKYMEDSSWALFSALITGMQNIQPRPRLVILTGDVLAHKFQDKFNAATQSAGPAAFRSFVSKTFTFIGLELQKGSAGVPVVYTLGNNDEECGDYALQPNGPFLQDTQEMVRSLASAKANAMAQWGETGSYTLANPLASHHRIIALNSNFWSRRYVNSCADKTVQTDPGQATMKWLAGQLEDARKHGDKVWLAYHIPPGIDGHSSSRTNDVVMFWKPEYAEKFYTLLDQYRKTIELNLAGHTHLDDIRLVKTAHTLTLVLMNPAVSPNVGQNPAYRLVTVDSKARPVDITTYFMPNLADEKWVPEYSTRQVYGLKTLDAKSFLGLYLSLNTSLAAGNKWKLHYSVSRPAGVSDNKKYSRSLYCAIGNTEAAAFQSCLAADEQVASKPQIGGGGGN